MPWTKPFPAGREKHAAGAPERRRPALDRPGPRGELVLADHYRLIIPVMRGHGRSGGAPPGGYTLLHWVDDVLALLDHLGIGAAHWCGQSRGGAAVLAAALRHPARLMSAITIDSGCAGVPVPMPDLSAIARQQGLSAAHEVLLASEMFAWTRRRPAVWARVQAMVRGFRGDVWLRPQPEISAQDDWARVEETACPLLALVAEHTLPQFHAVAFGLGSRVKGTQARVVGDAGHMVNMEQPEAVNAAILDFLRYTP